MNRRSFLRVLGLAPLGMVVGPVVGHGALLNDDRLPNTEEEVKKRLAEIERKVGVGKDGITAVCLKNGQVYKTIAWSSTGGPIKFEGYPAATFPNKEAAWAGWFTAFKVYHSAHRGKIHWRQRPCIWGPYSNGDTWETRNDQKFTGYVVSARLVADDL